MSKEQSMRLAWARSCYDVVVPRGPRQAWGTIVPGSAPNSSQSEQSRQRPGGETEAQGRGGTCPQALSRSVAEAAIEHSPPDAQSSGTVRGCFCRSPPSRQTLQPSSPRYPMPARLPAGSEMIETQEDIYVGSIETDRGVREQVRFYDTRGLREGVELPKHCFSCTDGYVLVYSIDSKESFRRVELLKKEIDKCKDKKEVTIVVLGNKCDLQEQRRVDHDAAQHWAKGEKVKLWEVSVADRRTLIEPFTYLASKMTQPQSKSAFPLSRKNKGSGSMDG
ncbi:unnamed protein product [Caretta caretta]